MAVKAKWKGGKYSEKKDEFTFISGVPARDLSDEEYAALDPDMKKAVRESPLYDVKSDGGSSSSSRTAARDSAGNTEGSNT